MYLDPNMKESIRKVEASREENMKLDPQIGRASCRERV